MAGRQPGPPDRVELTTAPAVALRSLGVSALGLLVILLVWTAVRIWDPRQALRVTIAVLLGVPALVLAGLVVVSALRLIGRGGRLVLDGAGFENRTGMGVGVRAAAWADVTAVREDSGVVVLELLDGRRSLVNTAVLGVTTSVLAEELRRRLDAGHGYTPLT